MRGLQLDFRQPRVRKRLLVAVSALALAFIAVAGGYVWYFRSPFYRDWCAAELSAYLGLHSTIGAVRPQSQTVCEFRDITVFLPEDRGIALRCEQAIRTERPTPENPENYELELIGGTCELSPRTWLKDDYRRVLESGLRPSFEPGGPQRVRFSRMDVSFTRDTFRLKLNDAEGEVVFESHDRGTAAVRCRQLNDSPCPQPVTLTALFSPRGYGMNIDRVELQVPRLPIAMLRLDDLLLASAGPVMHAGGPSASRIQKGEFDGRLTYTEDEARTLQISGSCLGIDLAEWSEPFMPVPWRGTCPRLELLECRIEDRMLKRLRFRGMLENLHVGDILAAWGMAKVGGRVRLDVAEADLSPEGIHRLSLAGACEQVSLDALSSAVGFGEMTGSASLTIDQLRIEENRVAQADAMLVVGPPHSSASSATRLETLSTNGHSPDAVGAQEPPTARQPDPPNRLSSRLIREAVTRLLNISIPESMPLPESVEYTQLGARLQVRDEVLHLSGTHGQDSRTILTIRLFNRDVPLVKQPDEPINMAEHLEKLRQSILPKLRERLEAAARSPPAVLRTGLPTTQPAR